MVDEFAAIDFETTGLNPSAPHFHRVIEIGIVRFSLETGFISEYESIINPQRDIGAFEIHQISAEQASDAPIFAEVASDLSQMLNGAKLVAHNKNFDLRFLKSELDRANINYADIDALCTMELVGMIKPNGPRRLKDCCELLGIELLDSHRALNDAKMAASIAISALNSTGFPALTKPVNISGPFKTAVAPIKRGAYIARSVTQGSYLRTLMARLTHQELPMNRIGLTVAEYLNFLERVLEDRRINQSEADELFELANRLMIPNSQLTAIHATYFSALCEHALSDGSISTDEGNDLRSVAELLNLGDWREIVNVSSPRNPNNLGTSRFSPGTTVCFTGSMRYSRQKCIDLASAAGLVSVDRVTKSLDILVVADPDSQSSKAVAAKKFGLRIIAATAFFDLIGNVETSIPSNSDADTEIDNPAKMELGTYEIGFSINGRDMSLWNAESTIELDESLARDELTELLRGLPSQEAQVNELQARFRELLKTLPEEATLPEIELGVAPIVRAVLTDTYAHIRYLEENSNVVAQQAQFEQRNCSEWVLQTLAMLSLIPKLPQVQGIQVEIWPVLLLEQIKKTLKRLRSSILKLKKSNFLIVETAIDFTLPLISKRLENLSIVITGNFDEFSREDGRNAILQRGGKSPYSVSGKTYALVVGEEPGATKLQLAVSKGIPRLDIDAFRFLLNNGHIEGASAAPTTKPKLAKRTNEVTAEVLSCKKCGVAFSRIKVKGRKPHFCDQCDS